MKAVDLLVTILLIIGGLNWGLVGLFNINVIDWIFRDTGIARILYILVGLAALYRICFWSVIRDRWKQ